MSISETTRPYLATREAAAARIEQLEAALRIYASDEVWRVNGRCNPNSPNFNGQFTARVALAQSSPPKATPEIGTEILLSGDFDITRE